MIKYTRRKYVSEDHNVKKCIEILIDAGADVNIKDDAGNIPLHKVIEYDHEECIPFLLESGADVNIANKSGEAALTIAAAIGNIRVTKHLLKANCRINMVQNALMSHLEFQPYNADLVSLLFAAGEILDDDGLKDVAEDVLQLKELRIQLKHICREAVRKHLLNLDPHQHLFGRIPHLGLPEIITQYLLYDQSLTDDDDDDDDDDFEDSDFDDDDDDDFKDGDFNYDDDDDDDDNSTDHDENNEEAHDVFNMIP